MALTYIHSASFEEQAGAKLDVDDYGADTLTRTFRGKPSLVDSFLADYKQGDPDATYSQLRFFKADIDLGGAYATATLIFKGILNRMRKPKILAGLTFETATLYGASSQSMEIDYMAPNATFMYCTKAIPRWPLFKNYLVDAGFMFQILETRGGRGRSVRIRPPSTKMIFTPGPQWRPVTDAFFNGRTGYALVEFAFERIGLSLWQVMERHEGRIYDTSDIFAESSRELSFSAV